MNELLAPLLAIAALWAITGLAALYWWWRLRRHRRELERMFEERLQEILDQEPIDVYRSLVEIFQLNEDIQR